jgi:serine/threonine protein kinase
MSLTVGTKLGPYEILVPIGAGGMGEVYRARDTRLGRDVAVKVLPEHLSSEPEVRARFEREARAVAAINHPNILALHDIGTDAGVARGHGAAGGGNASQASRKRTDSAASRARLGRAAGGRPAAAHERGSSIDLKPENVFITKDGRVKILDFGIAQHDPADEDRRPIS